MRYAVISDIHSNLQAMTAVLSAIELLDADKIVCLGDIVGYGGDPGACLDLVRRFCWRVVLGNHDAGTVGLTSTDRFNLAARLAVTWSGRMLSDGERSYLAGLPCELEVEDSHLVHATPDDPTRWRYLFEEEDARPLFDCFEGRLLFYGHTHVPMIFRRDAGGEVTSGYAEDFALEQGCRYIVNAGSVGQPRDRDPRSCFAVYDSGKAEVRFFRETYDIAAAQHRILACGLPSVLAERLAYGS